MVSLNAGIHCVREKIEQFRQCPGVAAFVAKLHLGAEVAPVGRFDNALYLRHDLRQGIGSGVDRYLDLVVGPSVLARDLLRQVALRQRLGNSDGVVEGGVDSVGELVQQFAKVLV